MPKPDTPGAGNNNWAPSRQSKASIGANVFLATNGVGFGVRFYYGKHPPHVLKKTYLRGAMEVNYTTMIIFNCWDLDIYGHWIIPIGEGAALYPLAGVGILTDNGTWHLTYDTGWEMEPIWKTRVVFSYGAGIEIALGSKLMLNGEFKQKRFKHEYILNNYFNNFVVGLAYKF